MRRWSFTTVFSFLNFRPRGRGRLTSAQLLFVIVIIIITTTIAITMTMTLTGRRQAAVPAAGGRDGRRAAPRVSPAYLVVS